jgi:hypothetical protein
MDRIFEIYACLGSSYDLERGIREYKVINVDKKARAVVCSREGSYGIHTIHDRAFDAQLTYGGNGLHFYTKKESNLKEYGKLLDEHMEKVIHTRALKLKKSKDKLGKKW